jgi:fibronectin-binding autotransporter adhesin
MTARLALTQSLADLLTLALESGTNNQDTTFAGNFGLQGFRGYDGIIKSGTGTLTLTGTYFTNTSPVVSTPGMQVNGGTLAVNSNLAFGANLSDGQANTVAVNLNGGTLEVTSSLANSAVTVDSNATLAGAGTVAKIATVLGGGTLAPGAASGTGILEPGTLALAAIAGLAGMVARRRKQA